MTRSRHKFASNVVEKSIAFGSSEQKREIVRVVTVPRSDGNSPLHLLMRDQFGNYVIRMRPNPTRFRFIHVTDGFERKTPHAAQWLGSRDAG